MPRRRRLHVRGGLYHAVLRGNHRQAIFRDHGDFLRFEVLLDEATEKYGMQVLAYCWMPNHIHLAVRVTEAPLGDMMRVLASRYARWLQRTVPTTGHLFERRYGARVVDSERYLLTLVRYIHLNPVRARLVTEARDYPWSSHRAYLGGFRPAWLCLEPVLRMFGPPDDAARAAYRSYVGEAVDADELQAIRVASRRSPGQRNDANLPPPAARVSRGIGGRRGLDVISAEVAGERGLAVHELRSRRRHKQLVLARVEVARRALQEGAGTLSAVARHLGRSPSTLSELLRDRT